jgi:hypothetical protein
MNYSITSLVEETVHPVTVEFLPNDTILTIEKDHDSIVTIPGRPEAYLVAHKAGRGHEPRKRISVRIARGTQDENYLKFRHSDLDFLVSGSERSWYPKHSRHDS